MDKPHWRCYKCDGSRYKIWKDKSISCTKCGYKPMQITVGTECRDR